MTDIIVLLSRKYPQRLDQIDAERLKRIVYIKDVKSSGTAGGTFTAGA